MNICSTGNFPPQYPDGSAVSQKPGSDSTSDIDQQIKTLEKEKGKLEDQRDKEKNPFAMQQSDKYKDLEKRIRELDKQIQQLKAEAASAQRKTDHTDPDAASSRMSFDTYVSEQQEFNG